MTETFKLRVYTLGQERVERDGEMLPQSKWRAAGAKELFFYFVFSETPNRREDLSNLFWGDKDAKKQRNNFNATINRARNAVGRNVIVALGNNQFTLDDNVDIWCDALEMEKYVVSARNLKPEDPRAEDLYQRAAKLYDGKFLPSIYSDWTTTLRTKLEDLYLEALLGAGQSAGLRGDHRAAMSWYRVALEQDRLNEETYRLLFSCYGHMEEKGQLKDAYFDLVKLFEAEGIGMPSRETTDLVEILLDE